MKLRISNIVPNGFIGITLYPFGIYFSEQKYLLNEEVVNHEKIHWEQQKELIGIIFYILYGLEWFIKLFIYGKKAYENLSFEREANLYEDDMEYLINRKRYTWINYIFINPIN